MTRRLAVVPSFVLLRVSCRRQRTSLLLVGDPDQLPPVGPGRPFAAALAAGLLPCIDLRQIYRSAAGSAIVKAAHAINQGERHAALRQLSIV
jgi:ATP-dependent exoDNAse (exonuclease V) alpha subunit